MLGKRHGLFTDVTKQAVVDDKTPEEIIRESSIVNGVLNERALAAGLEWLRLLRAPMPPRNEEPTQPDPESGKPALEVVS